MGRAWVLIACGALLACGGAGGDKVALPGGGGDAASDGAGTDGSATADSGGTTASSDRGAGGDTGPPMPDTGPADGPVSITAAEGVTLHGVYDPPPEDSEAAPAVLLVHGFEDDHTSWDDFVADLMDRGYAVLRIDLRGHGGSDDYEKARILLLNDPDGTPEDVRASLSWLAARRRVSPSRVGIVGTSIGANLAFVAMSKNQATAGVAISPRASAVVSLAGVTDQSALSFGPVMCVAGEADGQGAQMRTCEGFADQTAEPKATDVIAGSGAHGAQLLRNHPAAWTRVLEYLDSAL